MLFMVSSRRRLHNRIELHQFNIYTRKLDEVSPGWSKQQGNRNFDQLSVVCCFLYCRTGTFLRIPHMRFGYAYLGLHISLVNININHMGPTDVTYHYRGVYSV